VKDAIASAVALGAAFMEVFQERVDEIEILEAFEIAGVDLGRRFWRGKRKTESGVTLLSWVDVGREFRL
jgi:hypothetical protein